MQKSEAIETARKLKSDGLSIRKISDRLSEAGYVTATGKPVNPGTISKWLANSAKPKTVNEGAYKAALQKIDQLTADLSAERQAGKKLRTMAEVITDAVAPLQAEIAGLSERIDSYLRINKPRGQSPVRLFGFTIQRSGKYFKAYQKLNGKVRGVHIGPEYDQDQARERIIGAVRRNGGKWGLSKTQINSLLSNGEKKGD